MKSSILATVFLTITATMASPIGKAEILRAEGRSEVRSPTFIHRLHTRRCSSANHAPPSLTIHPISPPSTFTPSLNDLDAHDYDPTNTATHQSDILLSLGARHPSPSLGEGGMPWSFARRDDASTATTASYDDASMGSVADEQLYTKVEDVIYSTLQEYARRGLGLVGLGGLLEERSSEAGGAYEGMELMVRKPEYQPQLWAEERQE